MISNIDKVLSEMYISKVSKELNALVKFIRENLVMIHHIDNGTIEIKYVSKKVSR